ncbi:MAG: hypothetical protein WCL21_05530 [Mariniphaga sp.]
MNSDALKNDDISSILSRLNSLEERMKLLETGKGQLGYHELPDDEVTEEEEPEFSDVNISISSLFETKLGEYGLAWLGSIVLFFAIVFLWQYFNDAGKPLISLVVGVVSVAGVFVMSHYFRKSFTYLSSVFNLFGFIILYYVLLRLHYFTDNPLILNQVSATIALLILIGIQLYFAVKKQSPVLAGLAFTLGMITAYVSSQTQVFFLISIINTGLVIYSFWKYNWWKTMLFILCVTYLTYLIWLIKNHTSLIKTPDDLTFHFAFAYFSITTAIYSLVAFRKPNQIYADHAILATILLSGMAYSLLMMVLVFSHFPKAYIPFFTTISVYSIVYSILLKLYSPWKYSPALFALFGFFAISVTINGIYHLPDSFLLLICQSFLVLVLALWYRSHIITLINTFLLLFLALTYYSVSGELNTVNFTIPLVAFLSARLINWQKERLNIKTEFIRNIYLLTLFFSLLYATYKGLPGQYITVTWLIIGGVYFILSILIKSIKYRWMGMANLGISALYLFLVDMAKTDLIFRILAFLAFAIISIGISAYYVRKLKKNG